MTVLKFEGVKYWSELDEQAFFWWIDHIQSVASISGDGRILTLNIEEGKISDTDLRELLALAFRYGCDMSQFSQFLTASNSRWFFGNDEAYWHNAVFQNHE